MLRYADGQDVRVGDEVDFDGTPATVFDIVESAADMQRVAASEQSVGFKTKEYGEVYQSIIDRGWDETIVLLRRAQ